MAPLCPSKENGSNIFLMRLKHDLSQQLRHNKKKVELIKIHYCDTETVTNPYFPVFALNTEIYTVNLRIQSKYRKIRTRKNSVFERFLRSVSYT